MTPLASYSTQTHYLADGVTTLWDFAFDGGYLDKSHVKAHYVLGDALVPLAVGPDAFATATRIELPVPAGARLVIYRETPRGEPLVNWLTRSAIDRDGLNLAARQALYVAAEEADWRGVGTTGDLSALLESVTDARDEAGVSAAAAETSAQEAVAASASATAAASQATTAASDAEADRAAVAAIYADLQANPPAEAGLQAFLNRDTAVFSAHPDGIIPDYSAGVGKMTLTYGNQTVNVGVTYEAISQVNCTASIDAAGNFSILSMAQDQNQGSVTFRATYNGIKRDKRFSMTKVVTGLPGDNGQNSATVLIYQRAATAPGRPTSTATYTFSTASLVGLNNGWSTTIPAGSDPLWVCVGSFVSTSDTDSLAGSEWTTPALFAQNGTDGLNVATVFLFQRTTTSTAPTLPDGDVSYTFATGAASGALGGWSTTLPVGGGRFRWVTTATAASSSASDIIPPSEWAAARVISQDGLDGQQGLNTAIISLYQRAAAAPAAPSATVTYTFATAVATGLSGGWSQTIPAGTLPIWSIQASAVSAGTSDTIATAEWTPAVKLAESGTGGADGINTATVFLFQRTSSSSPPAVPSASATYTFSTGVLSGITGGWSQTLPASGGRYAWVTTATAASQSASDTILTSEWAAVSALAVDGADGQNSATVTVYRRAVSSPAVPSATVTYTFATASLSGLTNGWSTTVPVGSDPLWATAVSFVSASATDTAASGEWSAPVKIAENGTNGANGLNTATVFAFRRTTTNVAPAGPSATVTYTFATATAAGLNNGWTQGIPDTADGPYLWVTTATAASTGATDTLTSGEWAAVRRMAADGIDGLDGENAQLLIAYATAQAFTFAGDNATPSPASQTITLSLVLTNLSGTAAWTCTRYSESGTNLGTVALGGTDNVRTLTVGQFGAAARAEVVVSLGGFTDRVTIVRLRDGTNGSNGVSAIQADLDNDMHSFPASVDGTVTSYTGATTRMRVYSGITDDSANWSFSHTSSAGITAVRGVGADQNLVQITAFASNVESGYVDILATRAGYASVTKRFTLVKVKSAPGTSGPVNNWFAGAFATDLVAPYSMTASVSMTSDGRLQFSGTNVGSGFRQIGWYTSQVAGVGSGYNVRASRSGGISVPTSGPIDTTTSLASGVTWTLSGSTNKDCQLTVTVLDASTNEVVGSGTIQLGNATGE